MGRIIGDYHIVIRQLILCYITTSRLLSISPGIAIATIGFFIYFQKIRKIIGFVKHDFKGF